MNINRVISIVRTLKESPTNNTGSNGSTAGFSAASTGAMTGYDKLLHEPTLDQDYQTPYGLNYRLANVFPANKVSETDIDNMVDASKEYMDLSDKSNNDSRLDKLISIVKSIREEVAIANNASSGAIAGLPPDSPPVFKKKRKPTPIGRYGSRRMWLQDLRKDGK
jgi:hypothetical protein